MTQACDDCGKIVAVGEWPWCPHERSTLKVISDSIPGGLVLENLGAHPVTVYSHSERRMEMAKRGLVERVRHIGENGGDKSRHTSRWI